MDIWEERTCSQAAAGRQGKVVAGGVGSPTFVCRLTGRNNYGVRQTVQPRVPVWGNKASKLLTKNLWGLQKQKKFPGSLKRSLERPTRS